MKGNDKQLWVRMPVCLIVGRAGPRSTEERAESRLVRRNTVTIRMRRLMTPDNKAGHLFLALIYGC